MKLLFFYDLYFCGVCKHCTFQRLLEGRRSNNIILFTQKTTFVYQILILINIQVALIIYLWVSVLTYLVKSRKCLLFFNTINTFYALLISEKLQNNQGEGKKNRALNVVELGILSTSEYDIQYNENSKFVSHSNRNSIA